jgi:hypothetical protein
VSGLYAYLVGPGGLRLQDVQVADRPLVVVEGKGGHHRVVPAANRFFDALGGYLHDERPDTAATSRVFVVRKGPRRGLPQPVGIAGKILPAVGCSDEVEVGRRMARSPAPRVQRERRLTSR